MRLYHERFADFYAAAIACGKELFGFADRYAYRLFAQDMLPCSRGFDGPGHVQMIGKRIIDGLDFRVGEEFIVRAVGLWDSELRRCSFRFGQLAGSDGCNFAPFAFLHRGNDFSHRDSGHSQHTPFDLLAGHSISLAFGATLLACSCSVRACRAIPLLEFFFCANRFQVRNPVEAENSVEVVDFVLEQLRKVAKLTSLNLVGHPLQVLILHGDFTIPLDLHEDGQEAEASVPHDHTLGAALDNLGIHQGPRIFAGKAQEDDTLCYSNLRCGNAASVAGGLAAESKRIGKIFDERANFWSSGVLYFFAHFAQNGIAELPHRLDRHWPTSAAH